MSQPDELTRAEREVLALLAQGMTNKEIAMIRFRSVHTVDTQVKNILAKLGVKNRTQAARQSDKD